MSLSRLLGKPHAGILLIRDPHQLSHQGERLLRSITALRFGLLNRLYCTARSSRMKQTQLLVHVNQGQPVEVVASSMSSTVRVEEAEDLVLDPDRTLFAMIGLGATWRHWSDTFIEACLHTGTFDTVICWNNRGFGKTQATSMEIEDLAGDCIGLMDYFCGSTSRNNLIAASMAGQVAQEILISNGSRLDLLVIAGCGLNQGKATASLLWRGFPRLIKFFHLGGPNGVTLKPTNKEDSFSAKDAELYVQTRFEQLSLMVAGSASESYGWTNLLWKGREHSKENNWGMDQGDAQDIQSALLYEFELAKEAGDINWQHKQQTAQRAAMDRYEELHDWNTHSQRLRDEVQKHGVKSCVIFGASDICVAPRDVKELGNALGSSHFISYDGGHIINRAAAKEVAMGLAQCKAAQMP